MNTVSNAGAMPEGVSRTRVFIDGEVIEIALDWTEIRILARMAITSKTGRIRRGPLVVRVVS